MGIGKAWGKIVDVWSWSSILAKSVRSKLSCFLIFAILAVMRTAESLEVAFRKMRWSFDALYEGRWPTRDWDDKPMFYEKAWGSVFSVNNKYT